MGNESNRTFNNVIALPIREVYSLDPEAVMTPSQIEERRDYIIHKRLIFKRVGHKLIEDFENRDEATTSNVIAFPGAAERSRQSQ